MSSKGFDTGSASDGSDYYYNSACGSNGAGFLVSDGSSGASETTGWSDYGYAGYNSSNAYFPYVGGSFRGGARVGLFYADVNKYSNDSGSYYCARLSFRG